MAKQPITNEDINKLIKALERNSDTYQAFLDERGYVGDLDTTPMYSKKIADARDAAAGAEKDFAEASKKLADILTEKADTLNKRDKAYEHLNEVKRQYGKWSTEYYDALNNALLTRQYANEEIKDLEEQQVKCEQERLFLAEKAKKLKNEFTKQLKIQNEELSYQNKKLEEGVTFHERVNHFLNKNVLDTKRFGNGFSEIKNGFTTILSTAKGMISPWGELDQAAADFAKHIGLSAKRFSALRNEMISFAVSNNIEGKYNTNAKELIQLQEKYNSAVGRRVQLTTDDLENMAALKTVVGEDGANEFSTKFENFGLNQSEAANRVGDMFKESERYAVSFNKYSKNFLDNIKLAQNYTFEKGLKGLKEMALRATEIKLDIQQVSRFADKVSSVEGAMKTGASLSVLGGSFNQFSDPMRMLYYGLNDIKGLEKNIEGMFGKMAYFDKKTNQIEVSAFNRQRIKAAAEATGMDYSQLMESIYAQGRKKIIEGQLEGLDISKEERSIISNQAQLDENGQGFVRVNGEKKNVSNLSQEDIKLLTQTGLSDSENIKTIAQQLLGYNEKVEAMKKAIDDQKAYFIEKTGIGEKVKDIITWLTGNAKFLATISIGVSGIQALLATGGIGNGIFNMLPSFRGKKGVATMSPTPAATMQGIPYNATPGGVYGNYTAGRSLGMSKREAARLAYKDALEANMVPKDAKRAVKRAIRNNSPFMRGLGQYGTGIGMLAGIGMGLGGEVMQNNAQNQMDQGIFNDNIRRKHNGGSALSGAGTGLSTGLMIGSMFGPWGALIGGAIGAIGGAAIGYFSAKSNYKDQELRNEIYQKSGKNGTPLVLRGDYTNEELRLIAKGGKNYIESHNELSQKIEQQEGIRVTDITPFANGGIVNGKGSGISDSNLALLSNNEYIMPASKATKPNNLAILNSMRNGNDLIPRFANGGINNPIYPNRSTNRVVDILPSLSNRSTDRIKITPVGNELNTMRVSKPSNFGTEVGQVVPNKIEISPINVGGTIKLDLGSYSKEIDGKQLLNNPVFIKKITDEIMKRVNTETHMGYDKNSFYKKF